MRSRPGPVTGLPPIVIVPLLGRSKPASKRMSVLLPQPDGPIITVSLPLSMVKLQFCTTCLVNSPAPYDLLTLVAAMPVPVPVSGTEPSGEVGGTRCVICCIFILDQFSPSHGVIQFPILRNT